MEKDDIEIKIGLVTLNFFFTSELVDQSQVEEYEYWLELCASAIDKDFYNEEKSISLNISIADDREIKEINKEHRDKDKVTDVLSFPMQDSMRDGEYENFMPFIELGDIVVCKSVCEEQALEFKISYFEEFVHLIVHGFLHLYGYDHEVSEEEERIMVELEQRLVGSISRLKSLK